MIQNESVFRKLLLIISVFWCVPVFLRTHLARLKKTTFFKVGGGSCFCSRFNDETGLKKGLAVEKEMPGFFFHEALYRRLHVCHRLIGFDPRKQTTSLGPFREMET